MHDDLPPKGRILVVDDEPGVRESLRAILSGDHEVLTATSGEEALALLAREPVDIMTLDLRMPGMAGVTVLQRARHIDPDLEVLIITGYGSLETAVEGIRLRAFDYLTKPFDTQRARQLVQTALARRLGVRRVKAVPEQLLSSLSHELRTPLNVILGYSTMLEEEREDALSEEQRLALDRIKSNSASLLAYVETIFYMAELDRGVPLAVSTIALGDFLTQVTADLAPRAQAKGLAWHVDASADLRLTTDADKLLRLVGALADNAVRHTTSGDVTVSARPAQGGVTLTIHDTGPGIDTALIAETDDVVSGRAAQRPPRLLGFGLRLASRLARALGAVFTIAADATGTTCTLILPDLSVGRQEGHPTGVATA
jgi:signal transduction histidine kinase